jgi:hypothetical protein
MPRRRKRFREFMLRHPVLDQIPALVLAGVTSTLGVARSLSEGRVTTAAIGVVTVAALVMAAATFICAMTYQSANILMTRVRERFAADLRTNWGSILAGTFVGAVAPIIAIVFASDSTLVIVACTYSLTLVAARFTRAAFWLKYTLFMQEASEIRLSMPMAEMLKH